MADNSKNLLTFVPDYIYFLRAVLSFIKVIIMFDGNL